ncbi:hypothetical protein [Mesobacillus maritimus]|uniref:Uncharacterized protein n=1 Tax=Mesobacillus maritimus TaxID=1643336 RepID=A0ABS7KAG6_9BACI|nr:hypothetical protein [Mesobacillus maritimus]MBY0099236.1 hypothetical protein [Mesobacillus maritimus]
MKDFILLLAEIINTLHDLIFAISNRAGWNLTDKDLHLWVFGIVGILAFIVVNVVFKYLAQFSITAISFIYTFTVLVVIVFAIEIQQKLTGRGNMEFHDAVISLWGFILFFAGYLAIKGIYNLMKKFFYKKKH